MYEMYIFICFVMDVYAYMYALKGPVFPEN